MKEILLLKYGEIALKGANKKYFENILMKQIKYRVKRHGDFSVYRAQSTIYVEGKNEDADIDGAMLECTRTFGIITVSRAVELEKNIDKIVAYAKENAREMLAGKKSFKVESKRSDKSFPLNSIEISRLVGGEIADVCPDVKVDVKNPDIIVNIEIRDYAAYIHAGQIKGAGGMPIGSNGKALLLLSGGIDSPVAGHMVAKRGVQIEALHFESFPYTSERAREKVMKLAQIMCNYTGDIKFYIISVTKIQEMLVKNCDEDYFTLLLRRFMMRLAEMTAKDNGDNALVTGESIGQVASQTMESLCVTDSMVNMPVFRPCIGLDKEEIVEISRKIATFDTSILPYEDCCTVFTPKHPKTKPRLDAVEEEEKRIDFDALCEEAYKTMKVYIITRDKFIEKNVVNLHEKDV